MNQRTQTPPKPVGEEGRGGEGREGEGRGGEGRGGKGREGEGKGRKGRGENIANRCTGACPHYNLRGSPSMYYREPNPFLKGIPQSTSH